MKKIVILLLVFVGVSCSSSDDQGAAIVSCTEEFVFGLSVEVVDDVTKQIISEGIELVAIDDDYIETLEFESDLYLGAGERVGTYIITISGEGYITQELNPVSVVLTPDECHVITQELFVSLVPN